MSSPTVQFLAILVQARIARIREVKDDRGAISIELAILVGGLVVVGLIVAGVLLSKVNEKTGDIK